MPALNDDITGFYTLEKAWEIIPDGSHIEEYSPPDVAGSIHFKNAGIISGLFLFCDETLEIEFDSIWFQIDPYLFVDEESVDHLLLTGNRLTGVFKVAGMRYVVSYSKVALNSAS